MKVNIISLSMFGISLLFLPQCDWGIGTKKTEESHPAMAAPATSTAGVGQEVLLTVEGKPRITHGQFEDYKRTIFEAKPQLEQLITLMPDAEYELFKSMVNEELLKDWVVKNQIDQKASYQKDLQMITDFGRRQLAVKYFQEAHPAPTVTDSELRKFYEENKKTIPELKLSEGGVAAQAIIFDKAADATAFVTKAKETNFSKAAKENNFKVVDLKNVSQNSFDVEMPLKEKILSIKKYPTVETVTVKDKTYVVNVTGKTESQYIPFEQIKQRLEVSLNQQKMMESFTKDLEKLTKEVNALENKEYFERTKRAREEEMKKMLEQEKEKQAAQPDKSPASQTKAA